MKRAFIIHGWNGKPTGSWKPWLKKKLEENGFEVQAPFMPNPSTPEQDEWVKKLSEIVGTPDERCYFVGHSLGCITILRYLERIDTKTGGAVLVAGFTDDMGFRMFDSFFKKSLDWEKIRKNCRKIVAIHSDDDPYVEIKYGEMMRDKLGAELVIDKGKGHFSSLEGVKQLPAALDAMLKM